MAYSFCFVLHCVPFQINFCLVWRKAWRVGRFLGFFSCLYNCLFLKNHFSPINALAFCFKKWITWAGRLTQQGNVLATKPEDLSSIPKTQDCHGRGKELTSASWSLTLMCTYTYINKYNFKFYVNCLIYVGIFLGSVQYYWFACFNYKLMVCHYCYFRVIFKWHSVSLSTLFISHIILVLPGPLPPYKPFILIFFKYVGLVTGTG